MGEEMANRGKKRKSKRSKIISFDEETVTKAAAEKIAHANAKPKPENKQIKKPESKKQVADDSQPKKKPKKRNASKPPEDVAEIDVQDELDPKKPQINTEESIRARKRRRYGKLLEKRKHKIEADMQQKCLSYLSLWKHGRNEWKFEKLKQCWLLNNMYDDDRVPHEFYQTLVEYFNSSKGKAKSDVLKNALKVIQDEERSNEDDDDDDKKVDCGVKYQRARNIVQHLQE